jgi:hypothetical protein
MDHQQIKALATRFGYDAYDLLALAYKNDPFFVGTPDHIEKAEWFADLWERSGLPAPKSDEAA